MEEIPTVDWLSGFSCYLPDTVMPLNAIHGRTDVPSLAVSAVM
jgi:hypothetical protein